jgi:hypothetical protein
VACHDNACTIVGAGITLARAEFIDGTKDPNRGGQQRLDFVFYRADSIYCRLHPGSTKRTDAKPIFQPYPANDFATDRITAQTQWRSLRADAFAREAASLVPQIDRISKTEAYQSLQGTPLGPLTREDSSFPWWLFLANLGKNTQEVIGDGVVAATLEDKWEDRVQLLLTRSDGTEARLQILQPPRGTCVVRLLPSLV